MTKQVILALALVLAASACGASKGADPASTRSREDAMLDFARCMRAHGIDVQDPKRGGGGILMRVREGSQKKVEAAQKACQQEVPDAIQEPTEEEQQRFRDAALKFARCMRAHGVNVPDPKPSGKGGITFGGGPQDRPRFEKAQKACGGLLPGVKTEVSP